MFKAKGFTLIELMIVVAIMGILASTAILTFQYFIAKSQVNRVLNEAASLRTAIDYCITDGRTLLATSVPIGPAECDPAATGSNLQSEIGANSAPTLTLPPGTGAPLVLLNNDGSAEIIATFGNHAAFVLTNNPGRITWTRDTEGNWTCKSSGFDMKLAPNSCPI